MSTTKKAMAKKKKAKIRQPDDDETPSEAEKRRKTFLSRFFTAMFVVPGLFGALITIWGYLSPAYTTIALDNNVQLKNIFFGGHPWLITCAPYKGQPINPIFTGISSSSYYTSGLYKLAMMDCDLPMPSGKTVIDRFRLNKQKKYNRNGLTFTVANGGKPQIVPGYMMQNKKDKNHAEQTKQLNTYVTKLVAVKYGKVKNAAQLTKQCLSKAKSALVLVEGDPSTTTKSMIERLAQKYRTLWFCVADRSKFAFSLEKKYPDILGLPMQEGEGRLVLFRKKKKAPSENSQDQPKKGRKNNDIIMARPFLGLVTGPPDVDSFIEKTMEKTEGLLLMEALRKKPTLRYRGKGTSQKKRDKKRKAKKAKKKKNTVKKKKDKKKTAAPPAKKKEPTKPETPEERAQRVEREQKRRLQMDEEAKAHYAQAADVEEEEEEDDDDEDDDAEEVYAEDEEEDEDTIDLDSDDEGGEL